LLVLVGDGVGLAPTVGVALVLGRPPGPAPVRAVDGAGVTAGCALRPSLGQPGSPVGAMPTSPATNTPMVEVKATANPTPMSLNSRRRRPEWSTNTGSGAAGREDRGACTAIPYPTTDTRSRRDAE
jgi:hypothetical protein